MTITVACLDIYEASVKEVIKAYAPAGWTIKLAESYDDAEQRELVADADIILAGWAAVPKWMFDSPKLRFVQKFGVGYDKIDTQAARDKGICVAIANGMNAVPVSELVVLFILALYRKFRYMDRTIHAGQWVKSEMRSIAYSLQGKTVGIVGFGFIGKEVSKRVQAFNANVIYNDKIRLTPAQEEKLNVRYCEFDELIATADVVTLHLPSTPQTIGLINKRQLARMKPSALLINTARGELVVEEDLVHALQKNMLHGAALDVYQTEPLDPKSALLTLDNIVMTPHVGGTVLDNVGNMAEHCFKNMELFLAGQALPPGDVIVSAKN
jgi:phosphoglycerate dehydrogenase-like enzyme